MSFIINQNFDLKSPQFNFARDYFADVASLKAASENDFPDHFITNVAGTLYQLTKSNNVDAVTGKWRKYSISGYETTYSVNEKLKPKLTAPRFDSIETSTNTIETATLTVAPEKIIFDTVKNVFCAVSNGKYYARWNTSNNYPPYDAYNTSSGKAKTGIYSDDKFLYSVDSDTGNINTFVDAETYNSIIDDVLFNRNATDSSLRLKKITENGSLTDKNVSLPVASASQAGIITASDKSKLDNAVTSTENLTASKLIVGNSNKTIKVATGSGLVKLTNGVVGYDTNKYLTSIPTATDSVLGGIKAKSIGTPTTFTETQQAALINGFKSTTASSSRLYPVELFNNGRAFVHVPWTDTDTKYSLPTATKDVLGGIKIGFSTNAANHNYALLLSENGSHAYTNVPLATYNILNDTNQNDGLVTGAERRAIHLLSLSGNSLSDDEGFQLTLGGVIGDNNGTVVIPFVTKGMDDVSYGLMRGTDKNKLDGIEKGANKTTITSRVAQGDSNAVSSGGVYTALSGKVDKVTGKGLSTNDFTADYKTKLDNIKTISKSEIDNLFT